MPGAHNSPYVMTLTWVEDPTRVGEESPDEASNAGTRVA